ncbi:MAG: winged helix-turn-helix domain-containing protein [Anaerolineaceae bacterium]|nr:winged helix-turn-helix domain-containing protein [Anaerolineaceae bacterium]MCB9100344.1 winged helix-turn-helix domain-containing protein [Anaerolineales bacterium]
MNVSNYNHSNKLSNINPNQPCFTLAKSFEHTADPPLATSENGLEWKQVWSIIHRFLENGQYQQVTGLLKKAQNQPEKAGFDAEILLVAEHLCRLCQQYQTDVDRYRQAADNAGQLESELRQRLQFMLGRTETVSVQETKPAKRPRLDFKIYCFGRFQIFHNDQSISEWTSLKARSVLRYLAAHYGQPVSKETLMDIFWPDAPFEAARRNLHQAIYCLRHTLRREDPALSPILFENDCYLLNPALNIWVDYVEFKERVETGRVLEQAGRQTEAAAVYTLAERLYAGDFLADDLFEEWAYVQREHLRSLYLDLTSRLSDYYLTQQDYSKLIHLGQKVLRHDSCYEDAHRWLMWGYLARGQRQLALRQYFQCVETLQSELDVTPSPETQALYRQIAEGHDSLVLAGLEASVL